MEQLVLAVLKRWLAYKPWKGYEEKLAELPANPYERQLIKELCLGEWLARMKAKSRTGVL